MIVVLGASGRTGRCVARLVRRGPERVRLVTRRTLMAADDGDVETLHARMNDRDELRRALRGARAVYALLPDDLGAQHFHAERRAFVEALASALRAEAVEHVVALSSRAAALGEDAESGFGKELALFERRLSESVPALTLLRACYFQDNVVQAVAMATRDGVYLNCFPSTARVDTVAACDVAAVAARALLRQPRLEKEVVDVLGPSYSASEIATHLGEFVGRRLSVTTLAPEAAEALFRQWMSPEPARAMRRTLECVCAPIELQGSRCERGPTSLEQVLRATREVET